MKVLGPGDRVVLIGTDNNPFDSEMKGITSVFQKILNIPKPDYGSRCMLWRSILTNQGGHVGSRFDLGSLAKITGTATLHFIFHCLLFRSRYILTYYKFSIFNFHPDYNILRVLIFLIPYPIKDGYTAGHMVACAREVLTARRIQQQSKVALLPAHLVPISDKS